ncbi:hypothetical protein GCM10009564_02120 [Streptomyces thermogriseus]|uniref:Uncharacterized protein n=1 Tax=Streptomyces thermogriseus TaxID=75292 RepID=A0ABP4DA58_9ACTN
MLSEPCGNAVRACGDFVPLVAEPEPVTADSGNPLCGGVFAPTAARVRLHDPRRDLRPRSTGVRLDDPYAGSGRGPAPVELLAPDRQVAETPVGERIRCRAPLPGSRALPCGDRSEAGRTGCSRQNVLQGERTAVDQWRAAGRQGALSRTRRCGRPLTRVAVGRGERPARRHR